MSGGIIRFSGPILFALALAGLAGSAGWSWRVTPRPTMTGAVASPFLRLERPAAGGEADSSTLDFNWAPPPVTSTDWRYDVFTPPEVYRDATTGLLRARSRASSLARAALDHVLELLAVQPELFRLQLTGYVGGSGDYRVVLAAPDGGETWLVAPGHHFTALGLTVRSIEVRMPSARMEVLARAVLWDERSGAEVILDNSGPQLTGIMLAVMRGIDGRPNSRLVHEGEQLTAGAEKYLVERIGWHPPAVTLAWCDPVTAKRTTSRTLYPRGKEPVALSLPPEANQAANIP